MHTTQRTRSGQPVTYLLEVEDPTTGISRMFSGTDLDAVVDQADGWLDNEFGPLDEWEPIVWNV